MRIFEDFVSVCRRAPACRLRFPLSFRLQSTSLSFSFSNRVPVILSNAPSVRTPIRKETATTPYYHVESAPSIKGGNIHEDD